MTPNASYSVYCCSYEALLNNYFKLRVKIYTLEDLFSHLLHLCKSKRVTSAVSTASHHKAEVLWNGNTCDTGLSLGN